MLEHVFVIFESSYPVRVVAWFRDSHEKDVKKLWSEPWTSQLKHVYSSQDVRDSTIVQQRVIIEITCERLEPNSRFLCRHELKPRPGVLHGKNFSGRVKQCMSKIE